ncbi:MAG: rhodanese-like domain-containing protein [Kofleriaceae bacterium]
MRTLMLASVLGLAAIAGCSKASESKTAEPTAAAKVDVASISVDELDQQLANSECQAVDANGAGTRKKMGVIPGAVLLTDSEAYDLKELPPDKSKPLVFYCANTSCGASHDAADRAIASGYKNVKVLPDGIAGWVKAGKSVTQI